MNQRLFQTVQPTHLKFIGRGIYTLREAYHLTKIPTRRIVRWTRGYSFEYHGERHYSQPIIARSFNPVEGQPILDFLDLIEIMFLNSFRECGVSWKAIRIASQRARELIQHSHPFSTKTFQTDGRTILADFVEKSGDRVLLDLWRNQYNFSKIVSKYLFGKIEFNQEKEPMRWYPLTDKKTIVIDPNRNFGAPIIKRDGIPTTILLQSYNALKSYDEVAEWFDTKAEFVRDAIEYEHSLPN